MPLERFVRFVLADQKNAIVLAFLATLVPFFSWLGSCVLGVVTLRQGAQKGFPVLVASVLPLVAYVFYFQDDPIYYTFVVENILVWVLAKILRETVSWKWVLYSAALIGLMSVCVAHLAHGHISEYWLQFYQNKANDIEQMANQGVPKAELLVFFQRLAKITTGLIAAKVILNAGVNLLLARWLQAIVFNPGALAPEVLSIRLDAWCVGFIGVAAILIMQDVALGWDLLPVLVLGFFLAGLSFLHWLAYIRKLSWFWFIPFYILLVLLMQILVPSVALLAILDSLFNFRKGIKIA